MTFEKLSAATAQFLGSPKVFFANVALVLLWAASGPFTHFSDTWQLVINTATTVFTYLMLFILQSSANRDTASLHAKIDELIRALPGAKDPT